MCTIVAYPWCVTSQSAFENFFQFRSWSIVKKSTESYISLRLCHIWKIAIKNINSSLKNCYFGQLTIQTNNTKVKSGGTFFHDYLSTNFSFIAHYSYNNFLFEQEKNNSTTSVISWASNNGSVIVQMSYLKQAFMMFLYPRMTECLDEMSDTDDLTESSVTKWNTTCTSDRLEWRVM